MPEAPGRLASSMFQPPKMPDKKAMVVQKGGAAVGCSAGLFVWPGPRAARQRNPQAEEDPCLPESMLAFPAAFSSTGLILHSAACEVRFLWVRRIVWMGRKFSNCGLSS